MRVLVTGATGLIGCHAVSQLLDAGHAVRALVRNPAKLESVLDPFGRNVSEVESVRGDVTDAASVASALRDQEAVLHCAGLFSPHLADAAKLERINVEGTRIVLEAAFEGALTRIVFVSSMLALFPPRGTKMTADDDVTRPRSMYATTKARAERVARRLQEQGAPLTIVYPAACQGPSDPTFSTGPELVRNALRARRVLVTEGGLAYTDVRDLAAVLVAILDGATSIERIMAPSFFVPHAEYADLLERLTGRTLSRTRMPGWSMRALGHCGDLAQRLGRDVLLTSEAAQVLTRSVPLDDREARRLLGRPAIGVEESFRDLIEWLEGSGHLDPEATAGSVTASPDTLAAVQNDGAVQ
jgi:nucleoside-diphosphate-sugar epimerase